jgi:hypothetical protein
VSGDDAVTIPVTEVRTLAGVLARVCDYLETCAAEHGGMPTCDSLLGAVNAWHEDLMSAIDGGW